MSKFSLISRSNLNKTFNNKNKDKIITAYDKIDTISPTTSKLIKTSIKTKDGILIMNKAGTFSGYKLQDKYTFAGFPLSIENKKGQYRNWTDSDGNQGKTMMKYDYGYIKGTEGKDGDHVDCFVGPNEECNEVYIVHQVVPDTGKYDEDKVMLGFMNENEAKQAYLDHYDDPRFFGSISTMKMDKFKDRVYKTLKSQRKSLKAQLYDDCLIQILKAKKTYQVGEVSEKTGKKKVAPGKWEDVKGSKESQTKQSESKETKPEEKGKDKSGIAKVKDAIKTAMKSMVEALSDFYSGQSGASEVASGVSQTGQQLKKKSEPKQTNTPEKPVTEPKKPETNKPKSSKEKEKSK